MRFDFLRSKTAPCRKVSALAITGAFLFALVLSAAPRLHDQLHNALGADHQCAVTMLLSGTCDHSACVPPSALPSDVASTSVIVLQQLQWVESRLEFSLLEHAPPCFA